MKVVMNTKIKYIQGILKKYFLIEILFFAFFTKLFLFWPNSVIPFSFDHGKDSLAILHLVKTWNLKLIGPWTSIPGLFFGPAWYYLLAPGFLFFNGNPLSAVFIMLVLHLVIVWLFYRYFGKLEAIMVACSPAFTIYSTSAWNPFPMPLLLTLILIILKRKKIQGKQIFFLGLITSFGLHFSSAYVFFLLLGIPALILIKVIREKIKLNLKFIFLGLIGFFIPFSPQFIFELRHKFIETKAVIHYLKYPLVNQPKTPLLEVFNLTFKEISLGILPKFNILIIDRYLFYFCLVIFIVSIFFFFRQKKSVLYIWEVIFLIMVPIIGFSKLHFNVWYVYGMVPVLVVFIGQFLKSLPVKIKIIVALLFLLVPLFKVYFYYNFDKKNLLVAKTFLPIKLQAVEKIRELAGGKSFSSYHYVSDIYDYSYQYIYFWQAFNGLPLPIEFSYQPGKSDYVLEKPALLAKVSQEISQEDLTYIFYLVEKPDNEEYLAEWWKHQNYENIIQTITIGNEITLYQALPKKTIN